MSLNKMLRKVYNDYFKHAVHLKISGSISHETADYVQRALKSTRMLNPKAITLTIDSLDGSLVSSEIIVNSLKSKVAELNIPFYTFAHSYALGPAFIILASGTKSFANPYSIVGGLSSNITAVGVAKALEKYKVKCTSISTAPLRIDPFQKLTPQDEQWAKGQINHKLQLLTDFLAKQNNGQALLEKVKNGEFYTGVQALKEGVVGSLENFESVKYKEFKEFRDINYTQRKSKFGGKRFRQSLSEGFNVEMIEEAVNEDIGQVQFLSELVTKY